MNINAKKVSKLLLIVVVVLSLLHIAATYAMFSLQTSELQFQVLGLFDMDREISIPTWYSQTLMFILAMAVLVVAIKKYRVRAPYFKRWIGLSIVFLYASIDEGASIHELLAQPLRQAFGTEGSFLHFAWVIFGAALVAVLVLFYFKFWINLPAKTRKLFFWGSAIYIGGSIGIETIGGYYFANYHIDFFYSLIVLIEETMEMAGAILLIYTMLDYIKTTKLNIEAKIT